MEKLTKEQKREIDQIVRKYLPKFRDRVGFDTPFLGITGGLLGATSVALVDVVFMGGWALTLWTGAACMAGAGLGLGGGVKSGIYERERRLSWANFSGQEYEANRTIHGILNLIETKLHKAFQQAAENKIPYGDFKALADEVESDVKKLSPAFEIVSGGPNGYGTDKFEFVLDYKHPEIPKPKIKTLANERALTVFPASTAPQISALMKLVK